MKYPSVKVMKIDTKEKMDAAWRKVRIAEVLYLMKIHGLTLADLQDGDTMSPMVSITRTQTPHQPSGNTVAGE